MGRLSALFSLLLFSLLLSGCGGSSGSTTGGGGDAYTLSLSIADATLTSYATAAATTTLTTSQSSGAPSAAPSFAVTGLPTGASYSVTTHSYVSSTLSLVAGSAAPGAYTLTVTATDAGNHTAAQSLTLNVGVTTKVSSTVNGSFKEAMSTSFQLASWNDSLLTSYPTIPAMLTELDSKHLRMQVMEKDIPETADGVWDFTTLDKTVQPLLTAADKSPQFQIGYAPSYLYGGKTSGFVDGVFLNGYADYAAKLVAYYNKGGFTDAGGKKHVSPSATPIAYWGVYNEPNINGVTADEYVQIYNATVPAMLAVDPTLKFMALELSDWGTQEQAYAPTLLAGVTAPMDVLATHFYSTCNQKDADATLMATIPTFANGVKYLKQQLAGSANYKNTEVWVLENNVNADYNNNGMSACQPTQKFVADARGSSAFFAGWRPYLFAQLGRAGNGSLYHWSFAGDAQYGEFNTSTGKKQLSFWVDYWLGKKFPAVAAADVYELTSNASDVETLAVKRADGVTVVMVANHAVANATDNNGAGAPRSVQMDLSALGSFASAKQLTIDATTDAVNGPTESTISYSPTMTLNFKGYGVTFITLQQ